MTRAQNPFVILRTPKTPYGEQPMTVALRSLSKPEGKTEKARLRTAQAYGGEHPATVFGSNGFDPSRNTSFMSEAGSTIGRRSIRNNLGVWPSVRKTLTVLMCPKR
jgi:hypothetical protein